MKRTGRWHAAWLVCAAAAALATVGCLSPGRPPRVREWIGRPESALVAAWGAPDRVEAGRPGRRVLVYERKSDEWVEEPGRVWTDASGAPRWTPGARRLVTRTEVRRVMVGPDGRVADIVARSY